MAEQTKDNPLLKFVRDAVIAIFSGLVIEPTLKRFESHIIEPHLRTIWFCIGVFILIDALVRYRERLRGMLNQLSAKNRHAAYPALAVVVLGLVLLMWIGASKGFPPLIENKPEASLAPQITTLPQNSLPPSSTPPHAGPRHQGSLDSTDEPSERAAIRVITITANLSGGFEATIVAKNIGKYIALPPSFVRAAAIASPPLSPPEIDKLLEGAPDFRHHKKVSKPPLANVPNWQDGGVIAVQNWSPGQEKSGTVEGVPSPALLTSGTDYGWYVLTRAMFQDKLGAIPYQDSCTYFSLKIPRGLPCLTHND